MEQVNLSILKITGDDNDYLITDETARSTATQALNVANSKLSSVTLQSNYTSSTKTLTLSLVQNSKLKE